MPTKIVVRPRVPSFMAIQWTGGNFAEIDEWMGAALISHNPTTRELVMENKHGRSTVRLNEWIVREFYTFIHCSAATFDAVYERVET